MKIKPILFSAIFIVAAVTANLLINYFGKWATPFVAAAFIGLDVTTRDYLHEVWKNRLWLKMFILIGIGSVLTALVNISATRIALASFLGFLSAGIVDTFVYGKLIEKNNLIKINGSNLFSSLTDSFVFISVAFGFAPIIIATQFIAKFVGGLLWSPLVDRVME